MGVTRATALTVSLLLFFLAAARAEGPTIEVYKAANRTAAELLPLAETAMAGEGSAALDPGTNSIVLMGPPATVEQALMLLRQQDQRRRTVVMRYESKRVDELAAEEPRTREMAAALAALGIERSVLIAIEAYDANLWKSARNIPGVSMKPVAEINAHDLLRHHRLLITRAALDRLVATMRERAGRRAAESEPEPEAAPAAETTE